MSASQQCRHSDVHWHLHHVHMGDTNVHILEITGKCRICNVDLVFQCDKIGMSPDHPTIDVTGTELRIPWLGAGEEISKRFPAISIKVGP